MKALSVMLVFCFILGFWIKSSGRNFILGFSIEIKIKIRIEDPDRSQQKYNWTNSSFHQTEDKFENHFLKL